MFLCHERVLLLLVTQNSLFMTNHAMLIFINYYLLKEMMILMKNKLTKVKAIVISTISITGLLIIVFTLAADINIRGIAAGVGIMYCTAILIIHFVNKRGEDDGK